MSRRLQDSINEIIDEKFPMKLFAEAAELQSRVKNTFGVKCPKCGSEDIYEESVQTRSADEISSLFDICLNCNYRWRSR